MRPPAAWARIPPDPSLPPERREWHASWPHKDYLELPAERAAAPSARLRVRESLREWGLDALAEDAELVSDEIVANAVAVTRKARWQRGRPPVRLWTVASRRAVVILAWDACAQAPRLCAAGPEDESGRGLVLVAALAGWGHYEVPGSFGGKVVWAQLPRQEGRKGGFMNGFRCPFGPVAGAPGEPASQLLEVLAPVIVKAPVRQDGGALAARRLPRGSLRGCGGRRCRRRGCRTGRCPWRCPGRLS